MKASALTQVNVYWFVTQFTQIIYKTSIPVSLSKGSSTITKTYRLMLLMFVVRIVENT